MRIEKEFSVAASCERVWAFITDPAAVAPCIPGCSDVESLEPGRYRALIRVALGPIKTTFALIVDTRVERRTEYAEYSIQGEEGGRASRLTAVNTLTITEVTDNECRVSYESQMSISGRLGKFGGGVMRKVADNLGDKFVNAVRQNLEATPAAGLPPAGSGVHANSAESS